MKEFWIKSALYLNIFKKYLSMGKGQLVTDLECQTEDCFFFPVSRVLSLKVL